MIEIGLWLAFAAFALGLTCKRHSQQLLFLFIATFGFIISVVVYMKIIRVMLTVNDVCLYTPSSRWGRPESRLKISLTEDGNVEYDWWDRQPVVCGTLGPSLSP